MGVAAAIDVEGERQPREFPILIDEWAHGTGPYEYLLVAGFRAAIRKKMGLRAQRLRREWDEAFARYRTGGGAG